MDIETGNRSTACQVPQAWGKREMPTQTWGKDEESIRKRRWTAVGQVGKDLWPLVRWESEWGDPDQAVRCQETHR